MHRRSFLTAATLSAAGLASPADLGAQAAAPAATREPRDVPRHPQDAWFDSIPGRHRLFLDATNVEEAAGALGFAWNFLRTSQTGYNLKDEDAAVVICLRHEATEFAFSNDVWHKHDVLRTQKYKDPESGKKVKGGNILRVGSTDPKSYPDNFTFDDLAKRGVHFALCGVATRGIARQIAGKDATKEASDAIIDELIAGAVPNSHLMASGILAAQRAGEYGYTVIRG